MCCSSNIGYVTTSGIELEAKFRLDQLIAAAPRVEMRSNLSPYTSRVKSVPGPDNRLDQQAKATGNIGADNRLRGLPFTLDGNLNWVPGYITRLDVDQTTSVSILCTSWPLVVSCGTQQSKSRSSWSPVGMWAGCV